jgi:predicted enzyme related to lactoylglutathione lyase
MTSYTRPSLFSRAGLAAAAAVLLGPRADRLVLLATVRAATLDESLAGELRRGVLSTDHEAAGLGFGLAGVDIDLSALPPRVPRPKPVSRPARPTLQSVPEPEPGPEPEPEPEPEPAPAPTGPTTAVAVAAVTIDTTDAERSAAFWSALLRLPGYQVGTDRPGWWRVGPTADSGPVLTFQPVARAPRARGRVHLDLWVDDLDDALAGAERLGARQVGAPQTLERGTIVVMTDPDGNEFCLLARP